MTDNTKTFLGLGALAGILAWLFYDKDETKAIPETIDTTAEVVEEKPKQLSGIEDADKKEFTKDEAVKSGGKYFYYNVYGHSVYFTLKPHRSTPTGKLWKDGFPRVVKIYKGQIKPTKLTEIPTKEYLKVARKFLPSKVYSKTSKGGTIVREEPPELSGKKSKKKLSGKITLNPEFDYTAIIYDNFSKSKKETDRQNFKRSAEAYSWAKEQAEKNHHVAEIWQGHSNLLATYRWQGKTLKFQRS